MQAPPVARARPPTTEWGQHLAAANPIQSAPYAAEHSARGSKIMAMEQLAADTGGEAILNANDLSHAIARVVQNGSHYYTVIYTPTNKEMDGKYRRIEVKLNGGKYKLSYRRGYYADTAAKDAPDASSSDDAIPNADPLRPMLARGMPSATTAALRSPRTSGHSAACLDRAPFRGQHQSHRPAHPLFRRFPHPLCRR